MSKFTSPNGNAFVTVPNHQDDEMINRGMIRVKDKATKDRAASKKPKDSAKGKSISEVQSGETRTN